MVYLATPEEYRECCVPANLLSRFEADRMTVSAGVMGEARTLRVAGFMRLAVLRREQGPPTAVVFDGDPLNARDDAPLPRQ